MSSKMTKSKIELPQPIADCPATILANPLLGVVYFQEVENLNLENEIWESAFGLDGLYEVSNLGRVKSLERTVNYIDGRVRTFPTKIIKQCKIKHGNTFSLYVRLSLGECKCKNYTVAALVLNSFRKPTTYNNSTHHNNFISYDNRLENLSFENFHNKRQMEFKKGVRDGFKNTKHWKENGHLENRGNTFLKTVKPLKTVKGNGKTMFQQAGRKFPITIYFKAKNEVQTFSSIRNAALTTGIKEMSIRNAMARPHKYVRFSVKKGIMNLGEFLNNA